MSWSGFKKAASRAGTQVMMKTGHVEKTSDRSYEVEERRYRTLESASLRLQKEAKGYLDSLRAMTASQMRIAETIDAFYGESGAKDGVSRSYKQAVEDLDAETVKALDGPYRCVPSSLYPLAFDEEHGRLDQEMIDGVEREMNSGRGRSRAKKAGGGEKREDSAMGYAGVAQRESAQLTAELKLMDSVYRTTVLEPISRFCAYFPDINECIKKRNHKLLDYDAVRAKVRKLTEKPDKDPSKLPRTEKEAEMVSLNAFLKESSRSNATTSTNKASLSTTTPRKPLLFRPNHPEDLEVDLSVPSPPKVLEKFKRQLQAQEDEFLRLHSGIGGIKRSEAFTGGRELRSPRSLAEIEQREALLHSPSLASITQSRATPSTHKASPVMRESSTDALLPTSYSPHLTPSPSRTAIYPSIIGPGKKDKSRFRSRSKSRVRTTKKDAQPKTPFVAPQLKQKTKTDWLHPSELEQMMQPLKEQYVKSKADEKAQAKVAYDQLIEQLTTELPQLIDLRVPYLDPSFEALVKIQLRFCAEAYSRMAQVQQYLDASTRDQYAAGELDARVEEVLGSIRELSIAGTV